MLNELNDFVSGGRCLNAMTLNVAALQILLSVFTLHNHEQVDCQCEKYQKQVGGADSATHFSDNCGLQLKLKEVVE
jgi:hypothetical protein